VDATDERIDVRGGEDLLTTVVHHLTDQGITPNDLHAERATLEDVFLSLTDEKSNSASGQAETAKQLERDSP
jgi:ABC-2 type transport system ATP-binding protein